MKANTVWGFCLLFFFSTLVIYAARVLTNAEGAFEGAPQEFVEIHEGLQRFRSYLSTFATVGCLCAVAIVWKPKLGWTFLAALFTITSGLAAVAIMRIVIGPRDVFSQDWSLAIALGILAAFSWERALNEGRKNA